MESPSVPLSWLCPSAASFTCWGPSCYCRGPTYPTLCRKTTPMGESMAINVNDFNRCQGLPKICFPVVYRPSCGRENAYSVEKLEERRDASVSTAKESGGKNSELSAPEDTTEVQEINKGNDSCLPLTLFMVELHVTTFYFNDESRLTPF